VAAHHDAHEVQTHGTPDRILTVPNALSAVRLALLPLFVWLVLGPEADAAAVGVLVAIGLSDYLDGYLARRLDQTSKLGALLDPVADRLYILAAVVALGVRDIIPLWLVIGLPARDVFLWVLVPFLRTRGYSALPVHFLGKAATAALIYAFPLLLLGDGESTVALVARVFGWAFAIWGIGMYWWAGVLYAWQVRRLLATTPPVPRRVRRARAEGPEGVRPDGG
jgi:cardiolipin synthase